MSNKLHHIYPLTIYLTCRIVFENEYNQFKAIYPETVPGHSADRQSHVPELPPADHLGTDEPPCTPLYNPVGSPTQPDELTRTL